MKYIFVTIFSFFFQLSLGQTIKAKVVDEDSNPIEGVKVFFYKSTIMAHTNSSGIFEISKPAEVGNAYLFFYHPLYESLIESETDDLLPVYQLSQKADNFYVNAYDNSPFSKKEMLSVLKRQLLGTGKNARNSDIINLDKVFVEFDTSNNTLKAKSVNPLYIINENLGYHIEYHLEEFEVEFSARSLEDNDIDFLFNSGYSYFKDVDRTKTKSRNKILESSFKYYLKEIINDNYKSLKFNIVIKDKKIKPQDLFQIKRENENLYKISINNRFIDHQKDEYFSIEIGFYGKNETKILKLYKPYFMVDKFGNILNTEDFETIDDISNNKLADLLPIDYN